MAVPYTSYEAIAVSNGIEMLAASATWQAEATVTPKNFIVESLGGLPLVADANGVAVSLTGTTINLTTANAYALVHQSVFPSEEIALNQWRHRGDLHVMIYKAPVNGDAPSEMLRRMRNLAGGVKADIESRFAQGSNYFARGFVTIDEISVCDETTDQPNYLFAMLTIHWSSP